MARRPCSRPGPSGGGALAYAGLYEVNAYRLRRVEVPVLPAGARPIRVLHISDLHLTPRSQARSAGCRGWPALEPDLVINTGDNSRHPDAVPFVLRSLGRLLDVPGVFVWGSNDYYAPDVQEPAALPDRAAGKAARHPVRTSCRGRTSGARSRIAGWVDLTHSGLCWRSAASGSASAASTTPTSGATSTRPVAGPVDRSARSTSPSG